MEVTKDLLKKKFEEYNKLYFNNELSKCTMHYIGLGKGLGVYIPKKGKNNKVNGSIWINNKVEWNEELLKLLLIHEMIHHYIETVKKIKFDGLFSHGFFFRSKMNKINKEFGLNVSVHFKNIKFKK